MKYLGWPFSQHNKKKTAKKIQLEIIRSYPILSGKVYMVLTGRAGAQKMTVMFAQKRSKLASFWSSNIKFCF